MSRLEAFESFSNEAPRVPYTSGTVLETVGVQIEPVEAGPGAPPTPPVPFKTHTRSGEGFAQINDDEDNEHLYE